jgi:hypothetical protein
MLPPFPPNSTTHSVASHKKYLPSSQGKEDEYLFIYIT